MRILGIDPGKVQSWALLDIEGQRRLYVDHGDVALIQDAAAVIERAELVTIEEPTTILPSKRLDGAGHRAAIGLANGLLWAMQRVRDLERIAIRLGKPVVLIQSSVARRGIGIRISKGGVDAQIAKAIPLLVAGWPKRSRNHHRDGAVAAIAGYARRAK
jgi:hypothetical protein